MTFRTHFKQRTPIDGIVIEVKLKESTSKRGFKPTVAVCVYGSTRCSPSDRLHGKHYQNSWKDYTDDYGNFQEDKLDDMVQSKLKSFAESMRANIEQQREHQETEKQRREAFEAGVEGADLEQIAALGKEYRRVKDD